ncbi:MAG: hypothetical protein K9N35_09760 [Candidatus Marinimicrobia bacterium]|nr:hypothetical protein [Candidatus Neomarinimicrobiota bacterium]
MKTRKIRNFAIAIFLIVPVILQAQYKSELPSIPGLRASSTSGPTSIFGIDLSKIEFHNSYSMEVGSYAGNTVAMGLLKSSFDYMINPQVTVRGYVGLLNSPFSSLGSGDQQSSFVNGINKDNIMYGGEITYRPKENVTLHIGINRIPVNAYRQLYSPYSYTPRGN